MATDPAAPTGTSTKAAVVVTYLDWAPDTSSIEAGAYVPGVVESGGTCTLALTGAGGSAEVSVAAEADAGSTSCPSLTLASGTLTSGRYSAVVRYASDSRTGSSDAMPVDVP